MAFDDVRLPVEIERGSSGGPQFSTTVISLSGGAERRNRNWTQERSRWNVAYGIMNAEEYREVIAFYRARMGRLRAFRFKDWTDYEGFAEQIGVGDAAVTTFQLVKTYDTYTRTITRPVSGSVACTVDGSPVGSTVNLSTGVVTISPAPGIGAIVRASFEFDIPVRFEEDTLEVAVEWEGAASIPAINVIEVRE